MRDAACHALPADAVLARCDTTHDGLTSAEAARRVARYGANVVAVTAPVTAWRVLRRQFASVVVALLLAASCAALAIGEAIDALAILAVLALNVAIGFTTEWRARRSLDALRSLDVARAAVLRDGITVDIDAALLVPGDVIVLAPGAMVPADARLLVATELRVAEAALTGESRPVAKHADAPLVESLPLADRTTMVYKATHVVAGSARAVVVATGAATEVGRIGALASSVSDERTPLERRLDALGRRLALAALAVAVAVALMSLGAGESLGRVVETGIAVAIAAIPEGLPAVVTITMAVGVRRMAHRNALIRRLTTVESLGAATVVCTDKTGTLTVGEMVATELWLPGGETDVTALLTAAALANRAESTVDASGVATTRGDPTDVALLVAAHARGIVRDAIAAEWPEIAELPFSSERMWMATIHRALDGALVAFAKGAPSRIVERCDGLHDRARDTIDEANHAMASRGLRVLAVASGPVAAIDDDALRGLTFLGLVGLDDPPAPGVGETIAALQRAGVRTMMLTGDQQRTARSIAHTLGLSATDAPSLDGADVDRCTDDALAEHVRATTVFCRVSPDGKLRIVRALQRTGEVVAMLGDGVNDAPALRQADVGVAMGHRGTDVAKDAAGVVLADDRFTTIAAAVEEGRVVFDNIRRFVFFLLSCNAAEILVLLGAGAAGFGSPLEPLQLLWLNLLTDTLPALALAFEPASPDVMRRPPRAPGAPLVSRRLLAVGLAHAGVIALATGAALVWGLRVPGAAAARERAIAMAFMTLAFAQVAQLANARRLDRRAASPGPNRYVAWAVVATIALQLAAGLVGPLARVLRVAPLGVRDWGVVVLLSVLPVLVGRPTPDAAAARRPRS